MSKPESYCGKAITYLALMIVSITGCVTVNDQEPVEFLLNFAIYTTVESVKQSFVNRRENEFQQIVDNFEIIDSYGIARKDQDDLDNIFNNLESRYQPTLDKLREEIIDLQRASEPDSELNTIKIPDKITLKIIRSIDVGAYADKISDEVLVTDTLLFLAAKKLKQRILRTGKFGEIPDDADSLYDPNYPERARSSAKLKMALEFDDLIRFILAHELAHFWLDNNVGTKYEREIQADTWGIILASNLSRSIEYKSLFNRGDRKDLSEFESSLLQNRDGALVLLTLYEDNGIFDKEPDRPNFDNRFETVRNQYTQTVNNYSEQLSSISVAGYNFRGWLMDLTWTPVFGEQEDDDQSLGFD